VGFIPQSAWVHLEKDENLVETIQTSKVTYAKPLKVAWVLGIRHGNQINVTKPKKWMQYPSITIPKSFMGGIFPYLYFCFVNIVCILTLESNFYFYFFHVKFRGITKEAFVAYAIRLALEHH
jgi:hypothetical protein